MIDLLLNACHEVGAPLSETRLAFFLTRDAEILTEGEALPPQAPPSGKRGRTRQSKATNLLGRLRTYTDDVWRFATDRGVPFTRNLAEQAARMSKVKQKVSGSFRTRKGPDIFCITHSYLATLQAGRQSLPRPHPHFPGPSPLSLASLELRRASAPTTG